VTFLSQQLFFKFFSTKSILKMKYLYFKGMAIAMTLLCFSMSMRAQISGSVRDAETKETLPGANIGLKNTTVGTASDEEGRFSIAAKMGDILVISFAGFTTKEVVISSNSLDILLENSAEIREIVVVGLGLNKEKARLGYASQEVKGVELIKAREPNALNSLAGKVAGLTIGSSSEMLGAPTINLRGANPIIIVDGVPINSDTWNINPDDIESINVLKGPAAAAIYGSRSIDGAILITTKKGNAEKGRPRIEFNTSQMLEKGFNAFPTVQDEYGPGDHGRYGFVDGRGGGLNDGDYDVWGPRFEGQNIAQYDSPLNADGTRTPTAWTNRGAKNLNRFLRSGFLSNNNISVSTSSENVDMRYSTSFNHQTGMVPNTELNIANFNVFSGIKFSDRVKMDANINYNRQFTDNIPDVQYGPNSLIYNMVLWGGADWDVDDMKDYWQPGKEGVQQKYAEYQRYNNPHFLANEWLRGHRKTDIYGQTGITFGLAPGLDLKARTAITSYDLFRNEKFPFSATVYGREEGRGDYREDKRTLFENNTDLFLNFDKRVSDDFDVKALLGGNLRTFNYESNYTTTNYLNVPGLYAFSNSANPIIASNYRAKMQTQSAYYSADFGFKNFLYLNTTGRVDRLSTLPKKNNTFFYPSVGLSAVVSELANLGAVSFFKLRASFANVKSGLTQRTIGATPGLDYPLSYGAEYASSYDGPSYGNASVYRSPLVYNNLPGSFYTNAVVNTDLKPFSRTNYEVGFEAKFFKNRLGLDATYFAYIDGPQIFEKPISEASGYTSQFINALKTKSSGVEISLSGSPIKKMGDFSWNVVANWSFYRERLLELPEGSDIYNGFYKKGDRLDGYYDQALVRDPSGKVVHDGSGRAIINSVPQFLGNADPDWVWGLNNKFGYKNWSLGFQFDGRVGGVITNYIQRQTFRGGRNIATTEGAMGEARLKDWENQKAGNFNDPQINGNYVGEGVQLTGGTIEFDQFGKITNYDELKFAPNTTKTFLQDYVSRYYRTSEANLMSKTFTKLREVTISYNFPTKMFKKSILRGASVSLVGRNLLYFAEKKDIDLDQFIDTNYSGLQSPTAKRYGINVNLTF
jgi:TonB-linked SusC/RagA family outer membrane protein